MTKKLLTCILCLLPSLMAVAQNIKITHGPYLCDMTSDGVTVVWTTNKPAVSWVELAPDDNQSFYAAERPKYFASEAGRKLADRTLHKVRVSNLEAATNYRYRIYSKEVLDMKANNNVLYGKTVATNVYSKKPFMFRTYPDNGNNCSFVVFNDIHGRSELITNWSKDIDYKKLDFVALNGDMANSTESEEQIFKDYIDALVATSASETPIMFTRGNHETRGMFAHKLQDYFPTRDGNFYQLYTIGTTCFLVLDCGEDKPDSDIEYGGLADYDRYREQEAKWLEEVVQREEFKSASARIVFLHIPPPIGNWHGNKELQRLLMPILNKANIDVMFSGHTHKYSFHPEGSKASFPIVVNDNNSYIKCDVTTNKISVQIIDKDGKSTKSHEFATGK